MTDSLKALIEACRNGEANYQDLVDRVPYAR
ncbi:MAG TPA: thioesterase, partial [Alcanivorax sp.]|nr:thioesterase [Alcanivorax sp.]